MKDPERVTVNNSEKERYLHQLDHTLDVLITNLSTERSEKKELFLTEFAEKNKWNMQRLPPQGHTYQTLASLIQRIKVEYSWFSTLVDKKKPINSRAYFDEINISTRSGMPFGFDLVQLHDLKRDAKGLLKKMPSYADSKGRLHHLLITDDVDLNELKAKCEETWMQSMKRSFLEKLDEAELIPWKYDAGVLRPRVSRVIALGAEELWNLSTIQYSMASGMFQIYLIDVWQDIREPQIKLTVDEKGEISRELETALRFGEETAAWYILQSIDEKFKSLHPVHVSKALIGPFENRYLTNPATKTLPITQEMLLENPTAGILRANIQYTYAPNHREIGGNVRQVIYRDAWNDEILVVPAQYASRVAKSVLGNRVRIFES